MTSAMAIIYYPPLSLSLSLGPSPLECAKIFELGVWVALAIGYSQKRISLTLLLL